MRKYFLLLVSILTVYVDNYSQPCNNPSASFINQEDISNWLIQNPNCDEVTKDVVIGVGVENLDGLERIKKIGGYLSISNCDKLKNIKGLKSLTEVGGWIRIQSNPLLQSLEGLENLKKVNSEFFYIANNPLIKDLKALSSLDSIKGIFQIWDMDSLHNLAGLSKLKYIANEFSIFKNDVLIDLYGLDSLENIDGSLRIYENDALTTLEDINENLSVKSFLVIEKNVKLATCNAAFLCNKLSNDSNKVIIKDNENGCKNKDEVISLCTSSSQEIDDTVVHIYPNPTNGIFIIESAYKEITLIHHLGLRYQVKMENGRGDISLLPSGVYHFIIKNQILKIIKI